MGVSGFKPILRMVLFICLAMAFMHRVNGYVYCTPNPENHKDTKRCWDGMEPQTEEKYKGDLANSFLAPSTMSLANDERRDTPSEWFVTKCASCLTWFDEKRGQCVCGCASPPCKAYVQPPPTPSTSPKPKPSGSSVNPGPASSDNSDTDNNGPNPGPGGGGGGSGSPTPNSSSIQTMIGLIVAVMVADLNLG